MLGNKLVAAIGSTFSDI